ncbi:MAG TPA: hypothetical protein VLS94_02020 [Fusibacter sp.]|nr:hypothetical protein [Fusibacter sp.]
MTEFQKKKLIDLSFIIVGIILVGLFLKTQLSNPIILNVDETAENKTYLVGNYHEDDENLENSGVADIKSVSVTMDKAYIDVVIELRELPELISLQNNSYNWSIFFDVDSDETEVDDIVIEHKNEASSSDFAAVSDEPFATVIKRLKLDETEILGVGESAVEGNMLLLRIPNSNKLEINDNTPFKIILSHQIDQISQRDEMPKGK